MGIRIEKINDTSKATRDKTSFLNREIKLFGSKMSNKAREQFYSELTVLLTSGVNLKRSLDLISGMQKKKKDTDLVATLGAEIVAGSSLSDALKKNGNFSPYEFHAVKIGEQTGQLHKIAADLQQYFQRKTELRRQLITSLSYPIIVLITAVLVVFFMLSYVVPMFVDIFKQNNVELPWITRQIVALSDLVGNYGLVLLVFILGGLVLSKWIRKQVWFYKLSGKLILRVPVMGNYIKKLYLIQFTQAMALLTNSRIPVVNGIGLVRNMIRFYPLEKTLHSIETDIVSGEKLAASFEKHPYYSKKMIALLRVAEETNQTEYIFQKLYDQYSAEIKHEGGIITNVLNFLLTLLVGIIVGTILVAMYLPMFKLSSIIG